MTKFVNPVSIICATIVNTLHSQIIALLIKKGKKIFHWLVWLSGLSAVLRTKGSLVQFPVRAYAWAAGWVPSRGRERGNRTLMFLSLSSPLSKNK